MFGFLNKVVKIVLLTAASLQTISLYTLKTAGLFHLLNRGVMKCFTHYELFIWDLGCFGLFLCNSCAESKSINLNIHRLTLHLGCLYFQRHHVDKRAPP